jgi:hypothetical protein
MTTTVARTNTILRAAELLPTSTTRDEAVVDMAERTDARDARSVERSEERSGMTRVDTSRVATSAAMRDVGRAHIVSKGRSSS